MQTFLASFGLFASLASQLIYWKNLPAVLQSHDSLSSSLTIHPSLLSATAVFSSSLAWLPYAFPLLHPHRFLFFLSHALQCTSLTLFFLVIALAPSANTAIKLHALKMLLVPAFAFLAVVPAAASLLDAFSRNLLFSWLAALTCCLLLAPLPALYLVSSLSYGHHPDDVITVWISLASHLTWAVFGLSILDLFLAIPYFSVAAVEGACLLVTLALCSVPGGASPATGLHGLPVPKPQPSSSLQHRGSDEGYELVGVSDSVGGGADVHCEELEAQELPEYPHPSLIHEGTSLNHPFLERDSTDDFDRWLQMDLMQQRNLLG